MKIHHIGYMVKNLNKAISEFEALGFVTESQIISDRSRKVNIVFMINDEYRVELVEPEDEESIIWRLIKKQGNGPYHICYETDDIKKDTEFYKKKGYIVTSESAEAPAIDSRNVIFLTSRNLGMIELVESDTNE